MVELTFTVAETSKYKSFFQRMIDSGTHFLLSCHQYPDADSLASNLALAEVLTSLGKKVTMLWGPSGAQSKFTYLSEYIQKHNVTDKSIYEYMYDRYSKPDTLVILDCSSYDRIGVKDAEIVSFVGKGKKVIAIDHHDRNNMFFIDDSNKFIETDASSTCHILAKMLYLHNQALLTHQVCELLQVGIWTDTDKFANSSKNPEALALFAMLYEISKSTSIIDEMNVSGSFYELSTRKKILENLHVYHIAQTGFGISILNQDDVIAAGELRFVLDKEMRHEASAPQSVDTHTGIEALSEYGGINVLIIGVHLLTEPKGTYRLSIRSYRSADGFALRLAERFGGSGHGNAAGATISLSSAESLSNKLLEAIKITI